MSLLPDSRGDGRPPRAAIVSRDGRLVVLTEYEYAKGDHGWHPTHSRSTMYDSIGHVHLVSDRDLSRVQMDENVAKSGAIGLLPVRVNTVAARLGELAMPDALYAEDAVGCVKEGLLVVGTGLVEVAAIAAVTAAYGSCVENPNCADTIRQAQVLLTAADIALGAATGDYWKCRHPDPCNGDSPTITTTGSRMVPLPSRDCQVSSGGAGDVISVGGGGDGVSCFDITYLESDDGGFTWYVYDTATVCG